eukprot:Opistho-1_new@31740
MFARWATRATRANPAQSPLTLALGAIRRNHAQPVLREIGRLGLEQSPLNPYQPGQFFLHKAHGYRGVVLDMWKPKVYDHDAKGRSRMSRLLEEEEAGMDDGSESTIGRRRYITRRPYYQVAIHEGDVQTPEFANHSYRYVRHSDVIPYEDPRPELFENRQFRSLFSVSRNEAGAPVCEPTVGLSQLRHRNAGQLKFSQVHTRTSENVRVTVVPFWLGYFHEGNNYWWIYQITLEHLGGPPVRLLRRNWTITSSGARGTRSSRMVGGEGVVGLTPTLSAERSVFEYMSNVDLPSPCGHMEGEYAFIREGSEFRVAIPCFSLRGTYEHRGAASTDRSTPN